MTNENFEPQKLLLLTDDLQIKAYVHPFRISLLELLGKQKRTISSIAKELGVHPANITHHFKHLEKVGLIRLVEKRDTGKNLEKYYRAVAYTFEVVTKEKSMANKKALALSILKNDLLSAISMIKEDDGRKVYALLATARIPDDKVNNFIDEMEKLIKTFNALDRSDGKSYTVNLSLYPGSIDYRDGLNGKEIRLN